MVRMLLQRGASVNLQDSIGATALMHAANNGHTTIVQALLDAKADASLPTRSGRTALMMADGRRRLMMADDARANALLQTESGSTALMSAEHEKHTAIVQLLRQHSGEGLLADVSDAAYEGDAHAVAAWLDEGGGVDARCAELKDATLLMAAAEGGQEAMVRMLLQRGASVNLHEASLGVTALTCAASSTAAPRRC